jgi:hypothetical protein
MKSQASATSQPPPSANPLTAAITGIGSAASSSPIAWPWRANSRALVLGHRRHRRDVGPGDEGLAARAGQHDAPQGPAPRVAPGRARRLAELGDDLGAQRVEHLRPVDRDDADRAAVLDEQRVERRHALLA